MANQSDIIEQFIIAAIGKANSIEIGRNELANHFSVAPSQINYVLSTRFTVDRGYIIESRRGGGGYIIVARLNDDNYSYLEEIASLNSITMKQGIQIIDRLRSNELISDREADIILSSISDKALNSPFNIADNIRATIIREIIIRLLTRKDND